jgi:hypothetical protein
MELLEDDHGSWFGDPYSVMPVIEVIDMYIYLALKRRVLRSDYSPETVT